MVTYDMYFLNTDTKTGKVTKEFLADHLWAQKNCATGSIDANGKCWITESVSSCIERQDLPKRLDLTNAKKPCKAIQDQQVADNKVRFGRYKAIGDAAAFALGAYMATIPGAQYLAMVWNASSTYEWGVWLEKCEAFANEDAGKKEQACEAPYVAKYRAENSAIVKACNS
jgi:hypothetical protein